MATRKVPDDRAARRRGTTRAAGLAGAKPAFTLGKALRAISPLSAFEEVFDQRVAAALARLRMPDAQELALLRKELAELRRRVDAMGSSPKTRSRR